MYDNNDNNNNTSDKFINQKRVYKFMVTIAVGQSTYYRMANGDTRQVGFLNIDPSHVKTASFFSKLEAEIDKALDSGTIKFSGAFSIEANDRGANAVTENDIAW